MTTTAGAAATTAAPEVTKRQLSESWRRRLPLLPALVIVILLTQVPFEIGRASCRERV